MFQTPDAKYFQWQKEGKVANFNWHSKDQAPIFPFSGPIMGNCGYTQETAKAAIQGKHADRIAFGRLYISNPDLVERFRHGSPLTPPDDMTAWFSFEKEGYTDYPSFTK